MVNRLKARLIAKGYTQTHGVDFYEAFSPVAKLTSVRLVISPEVNFDWPLFQLDVKNVFLNGDLQEEVYMQQPPGFVDEGESHQVCLLMKALYGLRQSPRAWFEKLSRLLLNCGFTRNVSDYSVFVKSSTAGCVILVVYVDDIILSGSNKLGIEETEQLLASQVHIKDLGGLKYFLGI